MKKLNFKKYASSIKKFLRKNASKIIFEPGRTILGNAGYLISKVIYIKKGDRKDFIIIDAAMNDLIRPALYNAKHEIIPTKKSGKKTTVYFPEHARKLCVCYVSRDLAKKRLQNGPGNGFRIWMTTYLYERRSIEDPTDKLC